MKRFTKIAMEKMASLTVLPVWLIFLIHSCLLGRQRAGVAAAQRASKWPGLIGEYRRRMLFKRIISRMGKDVVISFGSILTKPSIEFGDGVYIGSYCLLGDVRIGDNTLLADHVCIPSGANQHEFTRLDIPIRQQPGRLEIIHIGRDCWIGTGAVILADIGDHCVVGAGSIVVKPVADYQIVAGNPAKPIGDRREQIQHE